MLPSSSTTTSRTCLQQSDLNEQNSDYAVSELVASS